MAQGKVDDGNSVNQPWKAFQVRQRNLDAKRDAVLLTAAHMFLEKGYRQTSMSELAFQLKITKPALYYYFRNKEEILIECYREGIAGIEGHLDAVVSQGTGLEKLREFIKGYATAIVSYEFGRCVAVLDESELSEAARRKVRALKRRLDASMRAFVEEGIVDGTVAPCNPMLASFAAAGAINWIGKWYNPAGRLQVEEIASEFARMLTCGLCATETKPRSTNKKKA